MNLLITRNHVPNPCFWEIFPYTRCRWRLGCIKGNVLCACHHTILVANSNRLICVRECDEVGILEKIEQFKHFATKHPMTNADLKTNVPISWKKNSLFDLQQNHPMDYGNMLFLGWNPRNGCTRDASPPN